MEYNNEYLANYDFLTGVPNRRYFWETLEKNIKETKKEKTFAFVIVDIDYFKKFNDTYGHDAGDNLLKKMVKSLKEILKPTDFIGRLGGEEFGILLKNHQGDIYEKVEKIREYVNRSLSNEDITISLGVAEFGLGGVTDEELYKNADQALCDSKENGRNRTTMYNPMMDDIG